MASTLSVALTVIGLLLVAYAVFHFASALVAGARRRDDRAARSVSGQRSHRGFTRRPDHSETRR